MAVSFNCPIKDALSGLLSTRLWLKQLWNKKSLNSSMRIQLRKMLNNLPSSLPLITKCLLWQLLTTSPMNTVFDPQHDGTCHGKSPPWRRQVLQQVQEKHGHFVHFSYKLISSHWPSTGPCPVDRRWQLNGGGRSVGDKQSSFTLSN